MSSAKTISEAACTNVRKKECVGEIEEMEGEGREGEGMEGEGREGGGREGEEGGLRKGRERGTQFNAKIV